MAPRRIICWYDHLLRNSLTSLYVHFCAELFWTGAARPTVAEALPRLHDVSYRMRQRGTRAISLQPKWCALRPGACDLTA
jgi:hypothetical protein